MDEPPGTAPELSNHAAGPSTGRHRGMRWQAAVRLALGGGLIVALAIITLNARTALDDAGVSRSLIRVGRVRLPEPTAINAALIYAQAAFQALVAIGIAVAGYILTRVQD